MKQLIHTTYTYNLYIQLIFVMLIGIDVCVRLKQVKKCVSYTLIEVDKFCAKFLIPTLRSCQSHNQLKSSLYLTIVVSVRIMSTKVSWKHLIIGFWLICQLVCDTL